MSHASTKGRIASAGNPCVAPRRTSIEPGKNSASTSMSGKLAPIIRVAAPRAVRFFRPASARAAPTSVWVRLSKYDFLRAFVEDSPTHLRQLVDSLDDGEEMIARQLSHLACEQHISVREDQLRLAVAAGVPEDLAGRGVARVVLEPDVQLELAEGNPASLTAPAAVHDALLVRQQLPERGHRLRRVFVLELGDELDVFADGDVYAGHELGDRRWAIADRERPIVYVLSSIDCTRRMASFQSTSGATSSSPSASDACARSTTGAPMSAGSAIPKSNSARRQMRSSRAMSRGT